MKMKKVFSLTLLLFFVGCYSYAQEINCLNSTLEDFLWVKEQEEIHKTRSLHPLRYYKVAFHVVRKTDGTLERQDVEKEIHKALNFMNQKYISANVQFYMCDLYYIDNDAYYDFNIQNEGYLMQTYNIDDAVNVYLFNTMSFTNGNAVWGYTYLPGPYNSNIIALRYATMDEMSTIAHEFGHFFGLPHTHNEFESQKELVDGSNCATAGDYFCDTPADPGLHFNEDVNENCVYTGDAVDANGDPYNPDVTLIMSYARHRCRTRFSDEQLNSINFWANHPLRICFSHMERLEDTTISSDREIAEDVIFVKNVTVKNDATLTLKTCAGVEISGDSEVQLGASIDVTIE